MKTFDLDDMRFDDSTTAFLFEGGKRAGIDISMFVVRTRPGGSVELHTHPYPETFLLLDGRGRWTAGDDGIELQPEQMLVVPPQTLPGFPNDGQTPLLVVSVHEAGMIVQNFTDREPA